MCVASGNVVFLVLTNLTATIANNQHPTREQYTDYSNTASATAISQRKRGIFIIG